MTEIVIDYNNDLEHLLKIHAEECESLSILHRQSFEKYNKQSNYINIPVIILSSAIGFATGIDIGYDKMNIILGVSSIFVGIIKSIDTYFQLGKRSESHRLCSLQFMQITKKLQIELSLHREQRQSAKDMLHIIKTDIKNLQDIAPLIDQDVIDAYNAKYGQYTTVKKPNFVNGLTEVIINSGMDDRRRNSIIHTSDMNNQALHVNADLVYTPVSRQLLSNEPSPHASNQPSKQPSQQPSNQLTPHASNQPSQQPSKAPSNQPSKAPSNQLTPYASNQPSQQPSKAPSNQPSQQPSNLSTPNKSSNLDMDELSHAIQLLQSQLVEQENIQQPTLNLPNIQSQFAEPEPALNLPNVIDIPNIQSYELSMREQLRLLFQQQNVPEDQIEGMIQQQLNNLSGQDDEGMM
jgi:hypothetical protein